MHALPLWFCFLNFIYPDGCRSDWSPRSPPFLQVLEKSFYSLLSLSLLLTTTIKMMIPTYYAILHKFMKRGIQMRSGRPSN